MATKPKTLADFRAVHDKSVVIPNKIKARLAAMLKIGPEEHDYESDFLRAAQVSNTDIGTHRQQFERHIVSVGGKNPKRVWFADPKVAAKARGE
jgi:hypothetical protein